MNRFSFFGTAVRLLTIAAFVCFLGCEDEPDTDSNADDYLEANPYASDDRVEIETAELMISPSGAEIDTNQELLVLTGSGGVPPYNFSAQATLLGVILQQGVRSAVYQRLQAGDNVVILTDSEGTTVFSDITQNP